MNLHREKSVDEMNTMIDNSGTPTVSHKGERDNKKKKMSNYMDEFHDELQ